MERTQGASCSTRPNHGANGGVEDPISRPVLILEDVSTFLLDAKENKLAGEKDKRRTVNDHSFDPSRPRSDLLSWAIHVRLGNSRYSVEVRITHNQTTVEEDKMPYLVEVELFSDFGFQI